MRIEGRQWANIPYNMEVRLEVDDKANIMASRMLLFPDPFGPEIEIRPGSKSTIVFLNPKDLNPKISTLRI